MEITFIENKYKNSDSSFKEEILQKVFGAEKNIALLRFLLVVINSFVYIFLIDKKETIEWLANSIIVFAFIYSLFILIFHPYRKSNPFLTSYFTSGITTVLIILSIVATGGFESPFYLLLFIGILTTAMRYTLPVVIAVGIFYTLSYLLILAMDINLSDHLSEIILRITCLLFLAVIGGLMSKETIDKIGEKISIEKLGEAIKNREQQLIVTNEKLEEYVKERTRELHNKNKQLLKINEDNDNFVYAVSHDLKTPLLNVEALINLLSEERPPQTDFEKDLNDKLSKSLERMKKTINSLAEVAKAQRGIYEDIENIKFSDVLQEVILENEEVIKKSNAIIHYDFHAAQEIVCSRTCIKSIIYNFLTNAIKYKDFKRDPTIEFRTQLSGGDLIFSVKDNGLGIDVVRNKEKLFKIFKRFHDHVEGQGIGLYTIKRMVEKFNGEINLESAPGVGSTFSIKFHETTKTAYLELT